MTSVMVNEFIVTNNGNSNFSFKFDNETES